MNDIHDLLGAYCTDALDRDERAAFEEHLATCDACREEAADFRAVLAALVDAHPVRPPSRLEDQIVAGARHRAGAPTDPGPSLAASARTAGAAPAGPHPPTPLRRRAAPWLAAAAAGAVLFAGGFELGRQQVGTEVASGADADMAAVVAVASARDAQVTPVDLMGTTSRVVMSGEMDKSAFLASDLPSLAGGMVYQVWSVDTDGQMRSAGSFTPAADGHVAALLDCGAAGIDKLVITKEPPGGSQHPTGEMLAAITT